MSEEMVLVEKKGAILTLTMNRPQVFNALNLEMVSALLSAFGQAAEDDSIRVVILTGAGPSFCSGADMNLLSAEFPAARWLDGMRNGGRLIRLMREMPQVLVAGLKGAAIGGGFNLALACDFVVAEDQARLRQNFVHLGLVLDLAGTYFLPRLVGLAKARELALLGEEISGRTAASLGLIYKSVPEAELEREVNELAAKLSVKPLQALAMIKEGLEGSLDMTLKEVLERESAYQALMLQSPYLKETAQRFIQSRQGKK
ncbi:MAG: enoyl-CoA hydratase-related protein [Thermodesulfobacteriota bacterium]